MKAMELSGVHLKQKVVITWKGIRSDKPYKKAGTLNSIEHVRHGKTVKVSFEESRVRGYYTYYQIVSVPYYADVEIV